MDRTGNLMGEQTETPDGRAGPGRPRSDAARQAVLRAALAQFEAHSFGDVTIKSIAAEAGVGRQTIYRWWKGKGDIALEALLELGRVEIDRPFSENAAEDLAAFLGATFEAADRMGGVLSALVVDAQVDPGFEETLRTRFIARRRDELARRFAPFSDRLSEADQALWLDLIFGAMWYRLLFGHAPLDRDFANKVTNMVLRCTRTAAPG